jgi:hypothetical protein
MRVVYGWVMLGIVSSACLAQTSWQFVTLGDSQGYDNGVNQIILAEIASEIVHQEVDCVLFNGDLVWSSRPARFESELLTWRDTMKPVYDANIPVYPCRGNHESWGSIEAWLDVFSDLPANGPVGEEHMTYSVTHKNALIVALDTQINRHRVNQPWLNTQLAGNTVPHVFVFGHEPAFSAFHGDCLDDFPGQRDAFWASLQRAGGRTYFSGHDHFFNHAHVDDGDGNRDNDLHQFICGTGGAPFYRFSPPYTGDNTHHLVTQQFHHRGFGYLLVDVNDLDVRFIWMQRDSADLLASGNYEPNDVWHYSVSPLMLLSPNGDETLDAGSIHTVQWQVYEGHAIDRLILDYSVDGAQQWEPIDRVANTGSYDWQVPNLDADRCLVRIADAERPLVHDVSFMPFVIVDPNNSMELP